jgi:PleD family two-component response regulator
MSTQSCVSPTKPPSADFKILIVDDNRDFVEFIRLLLAHHGYAVRSAFSGRECLECVRLEPVDLVILDVMMPQMDGLTVCRELKQLRPALPVILLTAKDDMTTRAAAMALGVSEFLAKPVNITDFLTRVRTQHDSRQWDEELNATLSASIEANNLTPLNT